MSWRGCGIPSCQGDRPLKNKVSQGLQISKGGSEDDVAITLENEVSGPEDLAKGSDGTVKQAGVSGTLEKRNSGCGELSEESDKPPQQEEFSIILENDLGSRDLAKDLTSC